MEGLVKQARRLMFLAGLIPLVVISAACGRHHDKMPVQGAIPLEHKAYSLQDTLAELDALEKPEGVDDVVWSELKGALREALETKALGEKYGSGELQFATASEVSRPGGRESLSTRKLALKPPSGAANKVKDLTATRETNGEFTLSWHYRNTGDYDQNGSVGVSDITPLAQHFGEKYDAQTESDSIQAVVDGSGNGKIGIEDVTQIAQNFGFSVHHYAVEGVNDYTQPYLETAQVALPAHSNIGRVALTYNLGASQQKYYRVVPIDADGTRGEPSNVVSTQAGDAPQILSVSPTEGDSGTEATFSSEVTGDGPFEYSWDFGGGATPGTSVDVSPTVILSNGGTLAQPIRTYQASLAISSPFGSVSYPFNLDVSARWHIEEIPKVPGHEGDEIEQALYDYAPDGALWGIHRYPGKYEYLFRWQGDAFEYEQLPWDHVYDYIDSFKVDKQGRPVVLGREYTGVLQWKPFFAVRTVEGWEQEEIDQTGQLMFDSANQAVIVYGAIWVARRTATGVWEKEQAVSGLSAVSYVTAALDKEDLVYVIFCDNDRMNYSRETLDGWLFETLAEFYADQEGAIHEFSALDIALSTTGQACVLFNERYPVGAAYNDTIWFRDLTNGDSDAEYVFSYINEAGLLEGKEQLAIVGGLPLVTFRHSVEKVQMIAYRVTGTWHSGAVSPEVYGGEVKATLQDNYVIAAPEALAIYW